MYLITWITTHLPTSKGWMAELAKARGMQPYIILYKTILHMGVRNLPKIFTRQRPGRESNRVSVIRLSDALPVSHRATNKNSAIETTYLLTTGDYRRHREIRWVSSPPKGLPCDKLRKVIDRGIVKSLLKFNTRKSVVVVNLN